MARSEARLAVSIWTDADFLALSPTAQRMFMFLISQPDLAHDGVIALRERRWSKAAAGLTPQQVSADLDELRVARFVVIDDDAEELLVRSFIRRDKVYRQPNVLRAAQDHLEVVTSPLILAEIAAELRRITEAEDIGEGPSSIIAEMLASIAKAIGNPSRNPSADPSRNPSAGTPGERGVVTAVTTASPFPVPRAVRPPAGESPKAPAATVPDPQPDHEPTAQTLIADWLDHVPKRPPKSVIGRVGKLLRAMLDEGIDPADIRRGLAEWAIKGLDPALLPSVVNGAMNARPGTALARASPHRESTTDRAVNQALVLAAKYAEEDTP